MSLKMTEATGLRGENLLVFTKKRGSITIREIDQFIANLNDTWRYGGYYYLPFVIKEEGYQSWGYEERTLFDEDGNTVSDKVALIRMDDYEPCHFCGVALPGPHCPHCGNIIERKDFSSDNS